jgi:hypothetical protein
MMIFDDFLVVRQHCFPRQDQLDPAATRLLGGYHVQSVLNVFGSGHPHRHQQEQVTFEQPQPANQRVAFNACCRRCDTTT